MDFAKHSQAINLKMSWSVWCIRGKTANIKVVIVFLFSPPVPVVKQSPFSLVPKLGYVRNYAVSMMCFPLLLVCPEVSYSSKHNHFSSTALEQEPERGAHRVCLFISVSGINFFCFLTLSPPPKHEKQAELVSTVLLLIVYVFHFSTLTF